MAGDSRIPQSQHPYVYSLNNPVNLSDPSGKSSLGQGQQCAQILQNQMNGAAFEQYVLSLYGLVKNKSNLMPFSTSIPDALITKVINGEIKLSDYIYLTPQLRNEIQYSQMIGTPYKLFTKEGAVVSGPAMQEIARIGGEIIPVAIKAASTLIDVPFMIVPTDILSPENLNLDGQISL